MAVDDTIKLTREQIATFAQSHDTIKQIEKLIDLVNDLATRVAVLEAGP